MSTVVSFNGSNYTIPAVGEKLWGNNVSNFLIAVGQNALSKAGGSFTLTADANFGSSFGIIVKYIKSSSSNIAQSGVVRFANNEGVAWRNAANNADKLLKLNASDRLELDGVNIPTISSTDTLTNKTIVAANNTITTASSGNLAATELNAALAELQSDIDTRATSSALTTHTGASTGVHGVTGSVVGTSDAQVITNKDIDGGTASNSRRLTVPKDSTSNLTALTRKQGTLLYDTTLGKLLVDNGSTLDAVGSGSSGGVTLISNPSDAGNWSETGTVFATPVTTTTSGDLPLSGATSSAIKFVATGNGAEASHYNSYSVTTSAAMNGKLQVDFFMRPGTGFAASEWTVSVYQGSTRQTLSSDSSGVTYLPNTTGRFTVTFDAVASTAYTLRFARVSGSGSATLNVCNVFLGWPFVSQTAPVGNWQSYTPTGSWVSNTTYTGLYRQVGSSLEARVKVTCSGAPTAAALTVNLPSGLTIDTSKLTSTASNDENLGSAHIVDAGASHKRVGVVVYSSTTAVQILAGDTTSGSNDTTLTNTSFFTFGASDAVWLTFTVPIAEWAGSVSTGPAPVEEYAYNSDVTSTGNPGGNGALSSSVIGSAGVAFSGSWAVGTNYQRRVQFQYPIQNNDELVVEFYDTSAGVWSPINPRVGAYLNTTSTYNYGCSVAPISATVAEVVFTNGGYSAPASFGTATGSAWSALSSFKWRVKKFRPSALPYQNAGTDGSAGLYKAGQAPGYTGGAITTAGYLGYMAGTVRTGTGGNSYSTRSTTAVTSSATVVNSIVLNKGVYLVSGAVQTLQGDGAARRLVAYLAVGTTQIQNGVAIESPNNALQTVLTGMVPIVITADSTTVGLYAQMVSMSGATSNNNHELWVTQIA